MPEHEHLFDTYHTHTAQCTTCKKALQRSGLVQNALKYSALVAATAGLTSASLPLLTAGLLAGAGAVAVGKVKKMFHEVPFNHQDND